MYLCVYIYIYIYMYDILVCLVWLLFPPPPPSWFLWSRTLPPRQKVPRTPRLGDSQGRQKQHYPGPVRARTMGECRGSTRADSDFRGAHLPRTEGSPRASRPGDARQHEALSARSGRAVGFSSRDRERSEALRRRGRAGGGGRTVSGCILGFRVLRFDQKVKDPRLTHNAFPLQLRANEHVAKDPRHHGGPDGPPPPLLRARPRRREVGELDLLLLKLVSTISDMCSCYFPQL